MNTPLAHTPPMGWNSWNTFGWNINEELIKTAADAFVETGLKDAGYEYIVIDDCWSEKQRDENGHLVPAIRAALSMSLRMRKPSLSGAWIT